MITVVEVMRGTLSETGKCCDRRLFRVLERHGADIAVLSRPPWLTLTRAIWIIFPCSSLLLVRWSGFRFPGLVSADFDELVGMADKALHEAKEGGRNRCVVWSLALEGVYPAPVLVIIGGSALVSDVILECAIRCG